jgi:SAM-dependent methyltransferase
VTVLVDGAANTPGAWTRRAREMPEPWRACGWSRRSQAVRFAKIIGALWPENGASLLDFGCGTGDLAGALNRYSADRWTGCGEVRYLGFDWSLGMVARAQAARPTERFTSMLTDGETWDHVVCCGPFNLRDNWSKAQTWALMQMLWARTRRAMAVSLYYGSDPACIRYPASEVAATASVLSDNFTLERGYLPNDLLVVLRR